MKNEPTKQERRFLALAQNYMNDPINENGEFPSHSWFEQMLDVAKPRVTYLKQSLIGKGYLTVIQGRVILTEKAIQLLKQNPKIKEVRVAQIQLLGQVSAGTKSGQELVAYIRDAEDYSAKSIAIPEVKPNAKIIALEVKGDSMESEGIFENDIVIVELTPNKVPRENTLIIAKYLLKGESIDIDPLRGPTLKVYKGEYPLEDQNVQKHQFDQKQTYSRLGRYRDYGNKNPHEIEANYVEQLGVVIGVYRKIR